MNNKLLFSLGTLLFNQLGVPYFLVKNSKQGVKTFVYGIITFGIVAIINTIKGILGGIKLFKMSAEDFAAADKVALINALPGDMNYKELIAAGKAYLSKKKNAEGEAASEEAAAEETETAYAAEETNEASAEAATYSEAPYVEPTYTEAAYTEAATSEVAAEEVVATEEAYEAEVIEEEKPKKKKSIFGAILGVLSLLIGLATFGLSIACTCGCGVFGAFIPAALAFIGFAIGLISVIVSLITTRRPSILGIFGMLFAVVSIVAIIVTFLASFIYNAIVIGINSASTQYYY